MKWLRFLPRFIRIKLIRQRIQIPSPPEAFQVNIATTQEELEKAYSLLHDCYVGIGLMDPEISGLRCNFYSFLPYTTTVVAKIGDAVVGTVSLIKDSPAGLPSDKEFKKENDLLRIQGHRLVEVSSLATDRQFRKKAHVVSLYLMKYLQHYTTNYMGCTTVTCVVHPRAQDFYAAFWGFSANKKIIKYKFVNNALGIHVYGDIREKGILTLASLFPSVENRNPIKFCLKPESLLIYPARQIQHHLDPVYTPELLLYFMAERTESYKKLSAAEMMTIYCAYSLFFDDLDRLEFFKELSLSSFNKRAFRFFARSQAILKSSDGTLTNGYISDISQNGAFLATEEKMDQSKTYMIEFDLGSHQFSIQARIRWQNRRIRNNNRIGYGLEFNQVQLDIARILKQTHLTKKKTQVQAPKLKKAN